MPELINKFRFLGAVSILFITFFVAGCSLSGTFISYDLKNVPELITQYNTYYQGVHNFYIEAAVAGAKGEGNEIVPFDFLADISWNENDSLYIKISASVALMNFDAAHLFVGQHSYVLRTRNNDFFRGFTEDPFVREITNLDLPTHEWGNFFLSKFTLPKQGYKARIVNGKLLLNYPKMEVRFRTDVPLIESITYSNESNETIRTLEFSGQMQSAGKIFPQKIVMKQPTKRSEIVLKYSTIKINTVLSQKLFEVKIPEKMEQIQYERP